ncbi:MAG: phosphatidylglycerol lysyltransferase domain-containing protein [Candidatus Saccharimonadales bacterium]
MSRDKILMRLVALIVVGNGLLTIANTLLSQLHIHSSNHISEIVVNLPLLSGLTLVYLGAQLNHRKRVAWAVLIPVYSFILGSNLSGLRITQHGHFINFWLIGLFLPALVLVVLLLFGRLYNVKSNVQNFRFAILGIFLTLSVALLYGVSGFLLLDKSDFHQEIGWPEAVHRTIDQFDLTTGKQLVPYTRRAAIFMDSLSVISTVAVGYAFISLFQPFRARHSDQTANRLLTQQLLTASSQSSEDFFKLWPLDKMYYVIARQGVPKAALAYRVQRGVALIVGEPAGSSRFAGSIIADFNDMCTYNDWLPAIVHVSDRLQAQFVKQGFQMQMIGQEAIVDVADFMAGPSSNKYFRQISNKFDKAGYSCELLQPPHSMQLLDELAAISDQWLSLPGRQERGFMMSPFSAVYLQQCSIFVARDQAGQVRAFLNQLPTFQNQQASYDLLRHASGSLGNVNDYLLVNFIQEAGHQGYKEVNLGLCPLSGIDGQTEDKTLIDSTLQFVYANGNRFYSFTGLRRFKAKYEPSWQPRYIAYKGGVRGLTRASLALNKALNHIV